MQIDLRHRPDMENTVNLLKEFKTKFREAKLSFHGNSPFMDIEKMSIINADELFKEAEIAAELGADIFTIHPPGLEQETITSILENNENQNRFLKTYCSFLAEMINRAKNKNKDFKVAVENLPVKNKEGKDISIEVMKLIIETTEKLLESQYGMSKEEAEQAVGITLDISNTSAIKGEKNREEVLKEWFSKMKSKIFCFHFYAPQEASPEFERKVNQFEVLYKEYELNVPIYLESKQPPSVTRELYKTITTTKD